MAKFASKEAKLLWDKYKDNFLVNYIIFAGFREYPKGSHLKEDIDSGPIINGIGASATAFSRSPAKI